MLWDYIRINRKDIMKVKEAAAITGSMTRTSKMPGLSYSLPAWECKTGSKLRKIKNSVCSMCYALKGNYTRYKAIKAAQYVRLKSLQNELWTKAMVAQITRQKYFRWHDAGDVQDEDHLMKIYAVCKLTPHVKHWMPTREAWVKDHLASCPDNLIVRLSAPMIDQPAPSSWVHTSTVVTSGRTCPAPDQGNICGSCRACWDKDIKNIAYGEH
jgi:hypothetical protein